MFELETIFNLETWTDLETWIEVFWTAILPVIIAGAIALIAEYLLREPVIDNPFRKGGDDE
ncbi:MAG: hypothetical protein U9O94_00755 [Nanoarchaeota archaeon]|nr:hypothetical protein [Nanoarchaeota archaeon]